MQDRVELVVMALRAAVGQSQEDAAHRVGDVQEDFLPPLHQDRRVRLVGVVAVEAGSDARLGAGGPELVAGDLLLDEPVVRLVGVERVDYVIPVAPCVRAGLVGLEPLAFREARQIEPVTGPGLAVTRRREQPVHDARECLGRGIVQERLHFLGGGRQAVQVERRAPDQGHLVRSRSGLDALFLQSRRDEGVDRVPVFGRGDFRLRDRLEGPVVALVVLEQRVRGCLGRPCPRNRRCRQDQGAATDQDDSGIHF